MLNKIFSFKGSLLPYITLFGFFLILAAWAVAGITDWYFVVGMALYAILIFAVGGYLQSKSKHRIDKLWDERKARYEALSTRIGYAFAMIAIGALSLIYVTGQSQVTMLRALMAMYLLIMTVQLVFYNYYLSRDAV